MKRSRPWTVEDEGIRPAGSPDKCLYCGILKGGVHKEDCVIRERTVVVKAEIEYTITVPEFWDAHMIEFHRNESNWCTSNGIDEITNLYEKHDPCFCGRTTWTYVREATTEDEENDGISVENSKG